MINKESVDRSYVEENGAVLFKVSNDDGTYQKPKLIIKVDGNYSVAESSKKALKQFKELVKRLPLPMSTTQPEPEKQGGEEIKSKLTRERYEDDTSSLAWDTFMENTRETVKEYEDKGVMVDTTENTELIPGLSPDEIRLLGGVLLPSDTIDASTRIGSKEALQTQADNFSEAIGYTEPELDRTADPAVREALEERIEGLREARELTLRQKELEETRAEQEKDITRLEKFKKWAKENLYSCSQWSDNRNCGINNHTHCRS